MNRMNDFRLKLDYRLPVEQSDINYFVVDTKQYRPDSLNVEDYERLKAKLITNAQTEVGTRFGAKFLQLQADQTFPADKINYFIVGLFDPLKVDEAFTNDLKRMKEAPNSRVNLAPIYEHKDAEVASRRILKLDRELGVNTIYQDDLVRYDGKEYLTISSIDVADNMVCETFRVKYKAIRLDDELSQIHLEEARRESWPEVQKMQAIYRKYQLWHRSPIDGAFMFLTKYGWLATATRTPKNNVRKQDLSLIVNFDENRDTITYVGDRLPSSDLPEFLVLVQRNEQALAREGEQLPVIKYLAHFHKNEITRNPKFKEYGIPFYRYGVFDSGHKFADEILLNQRAESGINIHGKGRGFIIFEHGLVRMGVELQHFEDFLSLFDLDKHEKGLAKVK